MSDDKPQLKFLVRPLAKTKAPEPPPVVVDIESFDDYDDTDEVDGVSRLYLVDAPRKAPTVIVEAVGAAFEVSRLRDGGTTVASVMWTREELKELVARIRAALEM